jgi:hypothetical protein
MNYREIGRRLKLDGKAKTVEHFTEAFAKGDIKPSDFGSVRQLFEETVDDGREALRLYDPAYRGSYGFKEAGDAVDTSVFSNITGQIVYNAILEPGKSPALVLTNLVRTIPTSLLDGEKIAGITGIGDLAETVAEGAEYPHVGLGEDYINTPATEKKGAIVSLTKEAIFADRTGDLLNQAQRLGEFLAINKEKKLADMIGDVNVTTHRYKWKGTSYASYGAPASGGWTNLKGSNGLTDWSNIDAAVQLLNEMVDPFTGEPILMVANQILVCPEKEMAAKRILNATEIRVGDGASSTTQTVAANPVSGQYQLASSIFLKNRLVAASQVGTNWYIGDFNKAFGFMEVFPLTVVQAPANSHEDFHRDIVSQYKASYRGAAVVLNPRAVVKNTVA